MNIFCVDIESKMNLKSFAFLNSCIDVNCFLSKHESVYSTS